MTEAPPSARRTELLDAAYQYVLDHGVTGLSLRPLAKAIGTSPRVLLYLFDSKDGLVREVLARARLDELDALDALRTDRAEPPDLVDTAARVWDWLAAERHRALLGLWVEVYGQSLIDPSGPWSGFARQTVDDWLGLLAAAQPSATRRTKAALARRTLTLAVLRGAMLDLLATGDRARTTAAVRAHLDVLSATAAGT
jgi:AcrR family transcriptional regulator